MMPTIRIEDDVMQGLKSLAEPFTDTPSSVIRRLLEEKGVLGKRKAPGDGDVMKDGARLVAPSEGATPQRVCEPYLLHVLWSEFKGRASKQDATEAVVALLKSRGFFHSTDLELVSSGETRVANTIAWARNALKDQGLISRESSKGIWELTPQGMERAAQIILPRPRPATK